MNAGDALEGRRGHYPRQADGYVAKVDPEFGRIVIHESLSLSDVQLEALQASGQVVLHTQPPPFPRGEAISKGGLFTWEPGEPAWRRI